MLTTKACIGTIGYMSGVMSVPEPFCFSLANMYSFSQEALCKENEHIHLERTSFSLHDNR